MRPLSSIRFRIVAAFLAATTTLLSAQVLLMVQYRGVSESQALVTEGYLPLALTVDRMEGDQQRVDTDIQRLLREERRPGTGAQSPALLYSDRLRAQLDEARIHSRQATQMATDPTEVAALTKAGVHLDRIDALFGGWQQGARRLVEVSEAGDKEAASALAEPLRRDARMLAEEIEQLSQLVEGRITRLTAETDAKRERANAVAGALAAVALLLSFVLMGAVLFALRPIARLTSEVQRLAAGDYSGRVEVRGADEIAILAGEFDRMVEALQLRDRRLVERAEQLDRLSRYLGSVLDSLEDGLFVVEAGVVTLANPAAVRLWGVAPDAPPPEAVRAWVEQPGFQEHREGGADYEVRTTPFGDNGVVVVTSDVTEQRRALDGLARSERLALVGQMLAQIVHEVRNPLNAMSLNAEMLAEEVERLDPAHRTDARDLLGTVSGEIERLTAVTAHYLQLARRPPARLAPEDLPALVQDVARLLQAELGQGGVTLQVDCVDPGPQLVDGNQVRQALLNVVRNAVEAGAHHLRLSVRAEAGELRLALTDDGPGMTAEEIDRAFDPFFSTKATGTGLGLAITRQILEDHGGSVRVDSRPGAGATVTLALPARPAAAAAGSA